MRDRETLLRINLQDSLLRTGQIVMDDVSGAEKEWNLNRLELTKKIMRNNPNNFLNWDVIKRTMFVNDEFYTKREYEVMFGDSNWGLSINSLVEEDSFGNPTRSGFNYSTSCNHIHQLFNLFTYEKHSSRKIADFDYIVEFGGGYGKLCDLVYKLGFRGSYIIIDFPEFLALQKYYLSNIGYDVDRVRGSRIIFIDDYNKLEGLQMGSKGLFIALWSLSETKIDVRNKLEALSIYNMVGSYFFGYQDRFNEVDNIAYFKDLIALRKDLTWVEEKSRYVQNNRYLIGS